MGPKTIFPIFISYFSDLFLWMLDKSEKTKFGLLPTFY